MPISNKALAAIGADENGFLSDKLFQQPDGIWKFSRGSEPVRELVMVSEFLDMSLTILQFDEVVDVRDFQEEESWDAYDPKFSSWSLISAKFGRCFHVTSIR